MAIKFPTLVLKNSYKCTIENIQKFLNFCLYRLKNSLTIETFIYATVFLVQLRYSLFINIHFVNMNDMITICFIQNMFSRIKHGEIYQKSI